MGLDTAWTRWALLGDCEHSRVWTTKRLFFLEYKQTDTTPFRSLPTIISQRTKTLQVQHSSPAQGKHSLLFLCYLCPFWEYHKTLNRRRLSSLLHSSISAPSITETNGPECVEDFSIYPLKTHHRSRLISWFTCWRAARSLWWRGQVLFWLSASLGWASSTGKSLSRGETHLHWLCEKCSSLGT